MALFRIFDVSASGRRVALRESSSVFHVVKSLDGVPWLDEVLDSAPAAHGIGTLRDVSSGRTFSVNFEAVGCTLSAALNRLQE